jgi:DNA-binding response OmpR family regulator
MPSVLAVDDQPGVIEMLQQLLEPSGFDVTVVHNGEDAIKLYKEENFDVVMTDIVMEPMDGLTLLTELKKYDPDAIVIMMSGYTTKETAIKALKHGAFDFQEKPFQFKDLLISVRAAAEERTKVTSAPEDGAAVERLDRMKNKDLDKREREIDEREKAVGSSQMQIEEAEKMLQEREAFLEMSENTLFEKGQILQEQETQLEQLKEDLDQQKAEQDPAE